MKKLLLLLLFPTIACAATANLTWDYTAQQVADSGVTSFSLERKSGTCAGTGTFVEVATPAATLRTVVDTVNPGSTYCWRIAAVAPAQPAGGGKSPYSNSVEKFIPFASAPAPGNLNVVITISLNPDTGKYQLVVNQ